MALCVGGGEFTGPRLACAAAAHAVRARAIRSVVQHALARAGVHMLVVCVWHNPHTCARTICPRSRAGAQAILASVCVPAPPPSPAITAWRCTPLHLVVAVCRPGRDPVPSIRRRAPQCTDECAGGWVWGVHPPLLRHHVIAGGRFPTHTRTPRGITLNPSGHRRWCGHGGGVCGWWQHCRACSVCVCTPAHTPTDWRCQGWCVAPPTL